MREQLGQNRLRFNDDENEARPGVRQMDLLGQYSTHPDEDIQTFLDVIAINWLIAGADGDAKTMPFCSEVKVRFDWLRSMAWRVFCSTRASISTRPGSQCGSEVKIPKGTSVSDIGIAWQRTCDGPGFVGCPNHRDGYAFPDLVATTQKEVQAEGLTHQTISVLDAKIYIQGETLSASLTSEGGQAMMHAAT